MRRRSLLTIAAITALAVAGCSDHDSDGPVPSQTEGAIRFAARTELSRAADITTNNLTSFNVYAYTGMPSSPEVFMDNVTVTKNSTNVWTYSPIKYWPAKQSVSFYAYAPAGWVGSGGPLSQVSYDAYPGTDDIVYAVSPDLTGNAEAANAQVVFNFRHALAKTTVKMCSTDSNLVVKVSNVVMANIMTKGNFNFPAGSTAEVAGTDNVGTWTDQNTPMTYVFHLSQAPEDVITLTTTPTDMSTTGLGIGGGKFVLPQTLSFRSGGAGKDTYLAVMCSVYDAKSGERLWPNENTPGENVVDGSTLGDGLLKFPLQTSSFTEWKPGVHYIYNLVINSNEEMGTIEFGTPTVDSYVEVTTNFE